MIYIVNNKILGIGQVTEKGVVFRKLIFSSGAAIKERWFERARINGPWLVFVIFDEDTPDKLKLIEPIKFDLITCYLIRLGSDFGEKLERYFQSIQILKQQRMLPKSISRRGGVLILKDN